MLGLACIRGEALVVGSDEAAIDASVPGFGFINSFACVSFSLLHQVRQDGSSRGSYTTCEQ